MAANISHCNPSTSRTILPPLQNSQKCRLLGKNLVKISFETEETYRNRRINFHYLQPNTSVCSTRSGNAMILYRKSNVSNVAKAILKPEGPLQHKPERKETEEKEEDSEYYNPKKGDLIVGVVVSSDGNKFSINIGSKSLASMHLSEFLPNNQPEIAQISCELPANIDMEGTSESAFSSPFDVDDYCHRFANGRMGILMEEMPATNSVIEYGTVISAEVLGRAFTGEALLSSRLCASKIVWQRVRQLKHINEPFEITVSEWNASGLVSRIEGLRAFLPTSEILSMPFDDLSAIKAYVGSRIKVVITKANERDGLVVSERTAWEMRNLYEGALLQGTIKMLYPDGAQVMVDGTGLSGFLDISEISCKIVLSVTDLFSVGERVKVMVLHFKSRNKLFLSTAKLESEEGLILSNKKRVFEEAEQVAAAYRSKYGKMSEMESSGGDLDTYNNTYKHYQNWDWFTN